MTSFNATESGRQPFIIILQSTQHFISRRGGDGGNKVANDVDDKALSLAGCLCIDGSMISVFAIRD